MKIDFNIKENYKKTRKQTTHNSEQLTDYSNSYVSGDMGKPNTKYWNQDTPKRIQLLLIRIQ